MIIERTCVDCNNKFTIEDGEAMFYQKRMKDDPTFQMPKRCVGCRIAKKKRFEQKAAPAGQVTEPRPAQMATAANRRFHPAKRKYGDKEAFNFNPSRRRDKYQID